MPGMIIDEFGLIRAGTDGGDSLQRTYSFYLLVYTAVDPARINRGLPAIVATLGITPPFKAQKLFEASSGVYIRNPEPNVWYDDPSNVSRDQLTPVICFLASMSNSRSKHIRKQYKPALNRLLIACLKRGMFAQNIHDNEIDPKTAPWKVPDWLDPSLWAIFARGYMNTIIAPIALSFILFGDLFLILSVVFKCFAPVQINDSPWNWSMPTPDDVDDVNLNNCLITTQWHCQTPFSWLARKIYKRFRPMNNGNLQLNEKSSIMGAIAWYNHNDDTDMTELYRPLVEKY